MHSIDVHVRYHHERLLSEAHRARLVRQAQAEAATEAPSADHRAPRRWQALLRGRWAWDQAAETPTQLDPSP